MSTQITDAPNPPPDFTPVARGERIDAIDFVRGVALLGILMVNVLTFFGPLAGFAGPALTAQQPLPDQLARIGINALCYTKFISLFSMLFGYGLLMQLTRAEKAGEAAWGFAGRRLGTLFFIGLLHGIGLWYGDILLTYSAVGLFVVIFRHVPVRILPVLAVTLLVYFALFLMGNELIGAAASGVTMPGMPGRGGAGTRGGEAIMAAGLNPLSPIWIEAETVAYAEGPYRDLFTFRLVEWMFAVLSSLFGSFALVLGQFLMGMWLFRSRFFDADQAPLRRRALLICLPIGLALEAVAAGVCFAGLQHHKMLWGVGGAIRSFSILFLPLGYLAAFTAIANTLPGWLISPVTRAGRMALTVYLGETVIATTLSYYYGWGLFGKVGPLQMVLIGLAIWASLVAFSWLWLAVLPRGPMEALWRLVGYGPGR